MSYSIQGVSPVPLPPLSGSGASGIASAGGASSVGGAANGKSFQDFLVDSISQVNAMQTEANRAVETMATGGDVSPAEVLSAVQKADLAFRLMMQVRNKLVQAYQDVQSIRV